MDNLTSAVLYTLLTAVVATYYWLEGRKRGVQETLIVFNEHEPAALKRVQTKLREMLGVSDS
jgi:hypothetical protein